MKTLLTIIISALLFGCLPSGRLGSSQNRPLSPDERDNKKGGGSSEKTPSGGSGGTTGTAGTTVATGDTSGSSVGAHCARNDSGYLPLAGVVGSGNRTSAPQWSSDRDIPKRSLEQGNFVTDSRLHVRILVREAPSPSGKCRNKFDYGKLSLRVSLHGGGSNTPPIETISFNEVAKGQCSDVLGFTKIPLNSDSNPFVLKIRDVKSDWDCVHDPVGTEGCNMDRFNIFPTGACWEIELHVATDHTGDIPSR